MQNNSSPITVYVIDDDEAICQSLRWLLESISLNVETFNSGEKFLEYYNPSCKGCLLIDVRMRGMNGLELQEQLANRHCQMPVIMISGHGDIPMAVRAMKAGAIDFITKPFNDQELLDLIQKALAQADQNHSDKYSLFVERVNTLTKREKQIMEHVVEGKLNKQIAYDLGISMKTVELHRARVMKKLQARSLAELVKIHFLVTT